MAENYLSPSQLNGFLNCNYHRIDYERGIKKKEPTFNEEIKNLIKSAINW